jgi:hypothetical protein
MTEYICVVMIFDYPDTRISILNMLGTNPEEYPSDRVNWQRSFWAVKMRRHVAKLH